MKLHDLRPAKGAISKAWRRGQGPGSGNGKTAGRGSKGQHSRSGGGYRFGFEGGQMPLYRRLPKRGFSNPFRTEYSIVSLERLDTLFADGAEVTLEEAAKRGLINRANGGLLKVLSDGELKRPLVIHAHKASAKAKEKIEAAGGRLEIIEVEVAPVIRHKKKKAAQKLLAEQK